MKKISRKLVQCMAWALAVVGLYAPAFGQGGFRAEQERYPRVREAKAEADTLWARHFGQAGLEFPPRQVYLRAFKAEAKLEVWVAGAAGRFVLLKSYPICSLSGELGPKSRQGDMQVPEGFYHISHFNPSSQFYLSLKVNYPNASDRKRSAAPALGGDIYLHGHCVSVGCLAMTDPAIKELYWLLVLAKEAGQGQVPCHIFPVRLTPAKRGLLRKLYADEPELLAFWAPLGQAYAYFEEHRRLPRVNIHAQGHYVVE